MTTPTTRRTTGLSINSPTTRPVRRRAPTRHVRAALTGLSDRLHTAADTRARDIGWTVTVMPGLFGLNGRSYRDPRVRRRARAVSGMRDRQPPRLTERGEDAVPAEQVTYTRPACPARRRGPVAADRDRRQARGCGTAGRARPVGGDRRDNHSPAYGPGHRQARPDPRASGGGDRARGGRVMTGTTRSGQYTNEAPGGALRAELPADLTSARQARSAVRRALTVWGIDDPDGDAELLASELVANAAEHASGPIGLALCCHAQPDGRRGITCEVTDASPGLSRPGQARPDDERGRGLAIVTALATASGVRAGPAGKTTWFTLALGDRIDRTVPQVQAEAEAEA
jgi:anti-sigma regulatory factor (Ser/Thr protein kinase)